MSLRGCLDIVTGRRIAGWVQDVMAPEVPVSLLISADDRLIARVLADHYRVDLARAGFGSGWHGFDLRLAEILPGNTVHELTLRCESDGRHCLGSPIRLPPMSPVEQAQQDRLDIADTDAALRAQAEALARQADRLRQLLADRRDPGLRESRCGRALLIDETLPTPAHDAGSNAMLSHAASLRRLGYAVTFVAADRGDPASADALEDAGFAAVRAPWCVSVEEALRREAGSYDLVYLHRVGIAARYMPLVRHYMPRARVIYGVADLHHVRLARQAAVEGRADLVKLAAQMRARELVAAWSADVVLTHSVAEAGVLRREVPGAAVHVVPWAVAPRPAPVPFAERRGLAFLANYSHPANFDAALWLIEEIMPRVRRRDPGIVCLLAGSDMPEQLRQPAPGVVPVGRVADVAEVFNRVRLTIAPLTYGAGIKGKVLDSLAAGIPCACTPVAAEGLPISTVAEDAEGLADLVVRLHNGEDLNEFCAAEGLAFVRASLSEARIDKLMAEVASG